MLVIFSVFAKVGVATTAFSRIDAKRKYHAAAKRIATSERVTVATFIRTRLVCQLRTRARHGEIPDAGLSRRNRVSRCNCVSYRRMKILHLDTRPDWRGGQHQILLTMRGLRHLGHDA